MSTRNFDYFENIFCEGLHSFILSCRISPIPDLTARALQGVTLERQLWMRACG